MSLNDVTHEVAKELEILFRPKRTKVLYGGRGGLKSWGIAQALEMLGYNDPLRILCTRELQGSIKESVHKLLSDTVDRLQMGDDYIVEQSKIFGKNGTEFFFEGLKNNTTKIKSMEGIDIAWVEEAEAITEFSWDILEPTIRKPGSEIWLSFNPDDEMGFIYQKFVVPYEDEIEKHGFYEDDDIYVRKTFWRDAEKKGWLTDELRKQKDKMKDENYNKYLHIWEGYPSTDYEDSIIQPEWVDAAIDAHLKLGFPVRGVKSCGFDPADEGADEKAYVIRHGSVVTRCHNWHSGDVEDATVKAWEAAEEQKCTDFVYDSIGVGTGVKVVVRQLQGNNVYNIRAFNSSNTPDNPNNKYNDERPNIDTFRNTRAQYWWLLRDRFEKTYKAVEKGVYSDPEELISLSSDMPALKLLKSELVRVQRKRGNYMNNLIQVESKQDMKKRGLRSPGLADSLVYCFANNPPKVKRKPSQPIDYSRMNRGIV